MALPNTVTASGAGTAADNITLLLATTKDSNGNSFFRDAATGKGIVYYPTYGSWEYFASVSASGVATGPLDYFSQNQDPNAFPLSNWNVGGPASATGTRPAPTFTASFADTTAPVPFSLSFSGTTGTLTWTEAGSPPVLQVPLGLPDTVTATGAGVAADNAVYTRSSANDFNGTLYYRNNATGRGIDFGSIIGGTSGWRLYNGMNADGSLAGSRDYESPTCALPAFPLAGWSNSAGGAAPPPSFTRSPGGLYTTNQGLTITGLSGGPVTISNVVTSNKITTFTTSRAIAPTETGGTLNGVAGAFSDSASPANTTAAFSIPITAGMFAPSTAPQNTVLAFFSPSDGSAPNLVASWQQPGQGQPDGGYNLYLARAQGAETFVLNVPGSVLTHTFAGYGYGTAWAYLRAVYAGVEGDASNEATATLARPAPTLAAVGQIINGQPAIVLTVT